MSLSAIAAVLTANTNHDNVLNIESVQKGQDLILVKKNPTLLHPDAVIFQTKQYTPYIAATLEDLRDSAANQKILLAKMQKNGTIKIYTLRNVGYVGIQAMTDSNGNTNYYLVDTKGKLEKIMILPLPSPSLLPYDPNEEAKKTAP